LSSISAAQAPPRALEDSFAVALFVLEDGLYPLEGHHPFSGICRVQEYVEQKTQYPRNAQEERRSALHIFDVLQDASKPVGGYLV